MYSLVSSSSLLFLTSPVVYSVVRFSGSIIIDDQEAANKGTDELFENVEKRFNGGTIAKEEYLDIKQRVEQSRNRENKLREREVFLSSQLASERGRLEELNQRLDFLERELGISQPPETRDDKVKKKNE